MTYRIPIQYLSRKHKGSRKSSVSEVDIDAATPLEAMRAARDFATGAIGTYKGTDDGRPFVVDSVLVRADLFREPR